MTRVYVFLKPTIRYIVESGVKHNNPNH